MKKLTKIIIVSLFILLGAAFLCYGAIYHSATISIPDGAELTESIKSEPALIKLVSIGGVKRGETGDITQTFGEGQEAPLACPT